MGIYLNGGTVMASGNMLDKIAGGSATYAVFTFAQPVEGGKAVWLKDADGAGLAMYSAENAFRYLVVSVNTMTEGDYTLWMDDVQLAHGGMGGRGPDGMGGRMPEGFDPSQMEGRQPPEGMEGRQPPEGKQPERPEGDFGAGHGQGGMNIAGGDQSEVFAISKGGNHFGGVSEYIEEE